ncbi:hypothetical protein CALVIDRAFT_595658 [Calocera viscosa TUFC12733]|uniref:Coenzyme Q-binding protein COQ10 START domain-containing protein n=1 Tax=Calocera viscosa (strain TUFC12733) TaxID=1330018 RepID=A0A167QVH6_CALVF|nr:hypothetical protein CALVIDRAFT_595658 [Calocera viscosa TUFC12733]
MAEPIPLVRGTLYQYSPSAREWVAWERPPQPPEHVWAWPPPTLHSLTVLTWNVSCEPAFAVGRAHAVVSQLTALGPDVAGLQEVSTASEDDAGAPGYRGRGFWDVLHESAFVRREYVLSTIEEQNAKMFDSDAPFGSVLLLRRRLITGVPQVLLWYCALESRDYSNLLGVDLCDAAGRPWISIATGQFEADPASGRGEDAEYALGSRQAQFRAVTLPGGALGRAAGGNVLLVADMSVNSADECQPFAEAGFTDVWRAARGSGPEGATVGGWGMQLAGFAPPGPAMRRRQDLVLARGTWLTGGTAEHLGSFALRQGYGGENFVDAAGRALRVWPSSHLGVSATLFVGPQEQGEERGQGPGKRARTLDRPGEAEKRMTSLLRPLRTLPHLLTQQNAHAQITRRAFGLPPLSALFSDAPSGSGGSGSGSGGEDVQTYHERKILPYDRTQLYNLVKDIPSYPHFIPYCVGARVLSGPVERAPSTDPSSETSHKGPEGAQKETEFEAELEVGFMGINEHFVSRVLCRPFSLVQATATGEVGMFKTLVTTWSFTPASRTSPHPTPTSAAHPSSLPPVPSHADPDTLAGPTLLSIDLAYSFSNPLHGALARTFFDRVSGKMVDAFERRCLVVYGPGKV